MYRSIANSGLFDADWYRKRQGLSRFFYEPLWHYIDVGWKQGKDPSPNFDTSHYLQIYPDVRPLHVNPLFHFVEHGDVEGRLPLRHLPQVLRHYFPDARELSTFLVSRPSTRRMSIVIDDATVSPHQLPLKDIVEASVARAVRTKSALRFISLLSDSQTLHTALSDLSAEKVAIEAIYEDPHADSTNYPIYPDEVIVATSWTSAYAIRQSAPDNQLFCLTPPSGETGKSRDAFQPLTSNAWRSLVLQGFPYKEKTANTTPHTSSSTWGSELHIALVANQTNEIIHVLLALRELENLELSLAQSETTLVASVVGVDLEPMSFTGSGVTMYSNPHHLPRVDIALLLNSPRNADNQLWLSSIPTVFIKEEHLLNPGTLARDIEDFMGRGSRR